MRVNVVLVDARKSVVQKKACIDSVHTNALGSCSMAVPKYVPSLFGHLFFPPNSNWYDFARPRAACWKEPPRIWKYDLALCKCTTDATDHLMGQRQKKRAA